MIKLFNFIKKTPPNGVVVSVIFGIENHGNPSHYDLHIENFNSDELKFSIEYQYKIFGVLYLSAIVLMTTVAIGNVIAGPDASTWLYAAGGVLFTISGVVLIFYAYGNKQKFSMRIRNLILYYLGQLLIAFSLFYV